MVGSYADGDEGGTTYPQTTIDSTTNEPQTPDEVFDAQKKVSDA